MNRSVMLLCALLCSLAVAAFARPPVFTDLTPGEAAELAAEQGKVVVTYWHNPGSIASEIMRARVWTDPEVEAWMKEHAVGVWFTADPGRERLSSSSTVVEKDSELLGRLYRHLRPKDLIRWLEGPSDELFGLQRHREEWWDIRAEFAPVAMGRAPIDDAIADRCVEVWRALPALMDRTRWAGIDAWSDRPFLTASRKIIEVRPEYSIPLTELRDELEASLAREPDAVNRWHWMMLTAGALDDAQRVLEWLGAELEQLNEFQHSFVLASEIEPFLEEHKRWAELYGFMRHTRLRLADEETFDRLRSVLSSIELSLDDERGEALGAQRDQIDTARRRHYAVRLIMRDEVVLHLGALASGELDHAAKQLFEVDRVLQNHPEAVELLVTSAHWEGLAHPMHLPFINYDRADHRALAAAIRRDHPDADEVAEAVLAQVRERLAARVVTFESPGGRITAARIIGVEGDTLLQLANRDLPYGLVPRPIAYAANLVHGERFDYIARRLQAEQNHDFHDRVITLWAMLSAQDDELANGLLRLMSGLHLSSLSADNADTARRQLDAFAETGGLLESLLPIMMPQLAEHGALHEMHLAHLDPDNPEHAEWIERVNAREIDR